QRGCGARAAEVRRTGTKGTVVSSRSLLFPCSLIRQQEKRDPLEESSREVVYFKGRKTTEKCRVFISKDVLRASARQLEIQRTPLDVTSSSAIL
ncbi:hypothetical protein ANANG_G00161120, partial [Anguilla anguilla]